MRKTAVRVGASPLITYKGDELVLIAQEGKTLSALIYN